MDRHGSRSRLLLTVIYTLLLVYSSLFPLTGWRIPDGRSFGWLTGSIAPILSRKDAMVNLLAYVPLGFLLAGLAVTPAVRGKSIIRSLFAGFCLSLSMELLQMLLPARNPSLVDLATNSCGSALGALLWLQFTVSAREGGGLHSWQETWLVPGRRSRAGGVVFGLWALARLSPFVPALSMSALLQATVPLWRTLQGKTPLDPVALTVHGSQAVGLALLADSMLQPDVKAFRLFTVGAALVLFLRIFIINATLTLETVLGYLAGSCVAALLVRCGGNRGRLAALVLLLAGFVLYEVAPVGSASLTGAMNWVPFRCHLDNTIGAISSILDGIWPFSLLALLWLQLQRRPTARAGLVWGGAALFLSVTALEWHQQTVSGRTADITQALLALGGWSWPLLQEEKTPPEVSV